MLTFNFPSNIPGFTPHTYRVVQYGKLGEYFIFWPDEDVLIGGFNKIEGTWMQVSGRQMPEKFAKYLGAYIEMNYGVK